VRVLLVSAEALPFRGGVAEVVDGLAAALNARDGIDARVLTRSTHGGEARARYPTLGYPHRDGMDLGLELASLLARLVPAAARSDAVIAADFISQRALSQLPAGLLGRRAVWLYCHGSEVLTHATDGRIERRQRLFRSVDGVMVNSRFTAALVTSSFAPRATEVIYPGIREELFHEPRDEARIAALFSERPRSAPLLVTIGRLDPRKGQDTLVRAVALADRSGSPVELAMIGEGPARGDLERLAAELGVTGRLRLPGGVSDAEKIAWIDAADLIVQASRRHGNMVEGLGLAMAEAGARGKVVVSTSHGGVPEVVRDRDTGVLLPETADATLWAERIGALVAERAVREAMGARAKSWVERTFRWQRAAAEVARLLGRARG